jgi:type VI protein secretion system component VasF
MLRFYLHVARFRRRYSIGGRGELRTLMDQTAEKIRRIRRTPPDLSPRWRIPPDTVEIASGDPLVKRFLIGAVACLALALVLFTTYKLVLVSGVSTLRTAAVEGRR